VNPTHSGEGEQVGNWGMQDSRKEGKVRGISSNHQKGVLIEGGHWGERTEA